MQKKCDKVICLVLLACLLLPAPALALDSFTFEAKVLSPDEATVALPFDGKIETLHVQTGDLVKKGDKLLTMQVTRVLAKEAGGVEAVFATPGADGKTVEETYHSAVLLCPANPLYVLAAIKGALQNKKNTTYHWGETLYLRSVKSKHSGIGRVINIKKYTYTVEILSGDLEENDSVVLYRDPEYTEKERVGSGSVHPFELTAINLDGFIIDVFVKPGDILAPGDVVLTYAPSQELNAYAPEDSIVTKADAAAGTVVLAPVDSLCLIAKLTSFELSMLEARSKITLYNEGNPDKVDDGQILWISSAADADGKFEIRISQPASTPRIGAVY